MYIVVIVCVVCRIKTTAYDKHEWKTAKKAQQIERIDVSLFLSLFVVVVVVVVLLLLAFGLIF